jgi:hypothetical protein
MKKDSFITESLNKYLKLNKKKKMYFYIIIILNAPFYSFLLIIDFIYMILISFTLFFSCFLRVDIKIKSKKLVEDYYFSCSSLTINQIKIIKNDVLINSYNKNFNRFYLIFSKDKKKDYKKILENFGFYQILGYSKRYLDTILTFLVKYDDSKINKVFYIKLKILIGRILSAIIFTINESFRDDIFFNKMKIIVLDFKITCNGGLDKIVYKIGENRNKFKIIGEYRDNKYRNKKPHLLIRIEDDFYSMTRSKNVKT